MQRRIARNVALGVLLACSSVRAADDVVLKAMRDELARSMANLRLEGLEKPYFIAYRVNERTSAEVSASFGSVLSDSEARTRTLTVEVRVGNPALDNSNFISFSFGRSGVAQLIGGSVRLPLDDDYVELRRQIWLATDGVYKKALEDLAHKRAALQNQTRTEQVNDFSMEEAVTLMEAAALAKLDQAEAKKLVRELSALFREMPDVFHSTVRLTASNVYARYLNSEGTSFTRATPSVAFTAVAATQAPDGMPLEDFVAAYGRSVNDLPKKEELAARIRELGARLAQLRQASLLDRYNGPVLFEGQAAAELFSQVFAPKLLAVRRPMADNPQFGRMASQAEDSFLDRIGSRVLPEFLSLVDNPNATGHNQTPLLGGYNVDDDGVRARETKLVENGVLKTLLTTRTPVVGIEHSTGNRRGDRVMPSNLILSAEKGASAEEMKERILRVVKQRGKDYGIIVRRIGNPFLTLSQDPLRGLFVMPGQEVKGVAGTLTAYKVFPDGHEELIRNLELSGFTDATFKEIVAVSKTQTVYTAPFASRGASPFMVFSSFDLESLERGGPLVSFVVPSLLFDDLTLKKPSGEVPKPPVAKHPYFDK